MSGAEGKCLACVPIDGLSCVARILLLCGLRQMMIELGRIGLLCVYP